MPLGQYMNPDDIAKHIGLEKLLNESGIYTKGQITSDQQLKFASLAAQNITTGLRTDWMDSKLSLTYESVMSHPSHIKYIRSAREHGFRTYLYYICTNSSFLNNSRVKQRKAAGGHDVPEHKVRTRYTKSLDNLYDMARECRRAYFFDNSGKEAVHFAEITPEGYLDIMEKRFNACNPQWFQLSLLEKWDRKKIRLATL